MRTAAIISLYLTVVPLGAIAEDGVERGKALAEQWRCFHCHGLTGNDRSVREFPIPMLAGQPASFLAKRLNEYKAI